MRVLVGGLEVAHPVEIHEKPQMGREIHEKPQMGSKGEAGGIGVSTLKSISASLS